MSKKQMTRRALLTSVISLILCCAMLVGTTFAWFTDSVSSGKNQIVAGNLDIELEYYNGTTWEAVNADTNVFEEGTLWEPGHTEVVYLKVSNLGTLALKYNLGVNIAFEKTSINVAGEELKVSDYLEVGVIEDVSTPYATREAARAAVTSTTALNVGYAKPGTLYPTTNLPTDGVSEEYVALVVFMPETVGNEANYRTGEEAPEVTLGINLMAAQMTYESDSFDHLYDENAIYAGIPSAQVTKISDLPTVTTINNNTYPLNVGYLFETTEEYDAAQQNSHAKWHADFVATFDQNVSDGAFGLAGQYDSFSADWLAFEVEGISVKANEPIRMLETAGISMNYEELCLLVKEFRCGAFAVDPVKMAGKTVTVELRIYETEAPSEENGNSVNVETGKYQTIGAYSYTFPAVEDPSKPADLPVANVANADQFEGVELDWNKQYNVYPPDGTKLEAVYTFSAQDDYDAALASPYAKWNADYYVTLDRDLEDDQLVLGGNYGSYGWIGFTAPGGVAANTATPLLQTAGLTVNYEEIILLVQEFTCGVADINDALSGATIIVELRLTSPDGTQSYMVNSTTYTFQ